jgi:hypothetical protein
VSTDIERLADKLQVSLADRTPDGRFRTGDKVIVTASGAYAAIASGNVKEVDDKYPSRVTVTTRHGDLVCSSYNLLHDLTSTASKDMVTTYVNY